MVRIRTICRALPVLAVLILLSGAPASSADYKLVVCSQSQSEHDVAVAFSTARYLRPVIVIKGWFAVDPGDCMTIFEGYFFVREIFVSLTRIPQDAESFVVDWDTDVQAHFCVRREPFDYYFESVEHARSCENYDGFWPLLFNILITPADSPYLTEVFTLTFSDDRFEWTNDKIGSGRPSDIGPGPVYDPCSDPLMASANPWCG